MTTWRLLKGQVPYDKQAMYEIYSLMDLPAMVGQCEEQRAIAQHDDAFALFAAAGKRMGLCGNEVRGIVSARLRRDYGKIPSVQDWFRHAKPEWKTWHQFDPVIPFEACQREYTADVDKVSRRIIELIGDVPACVLQHSLGAAMVERALGPWLSGFPVRCVAETVIEAVRIGVPSPGHYTRPLQGKLPEFAKRVVTQA
jgi:hypothetical protein